jgi:hypothetical protein
MVVEYVYALVNHWVCIKERGGLISIFHYGGHLFIVAPLKFRIYFFRFDELSSCVFYMGVA